MNYKSKTFLFSFLFILLGTFLSPLFYCIGGGKSSLSLNAKTEVNPTPSVSQAVGIQTVLYQLQQKKLSIYK